MTGSVLAKVSRQRRANVARVLRISGAGAALAGPRGPRRCQVWSVGRRDGPVLRKLGKVLRRCHPSPLAVRLSWKALLICSQSNQVWPQLLRRHPVPGGKLACGDGCLARSQLAHSLDGAFCPAATLEPKHALELTKCTMDALARHYEMRSLAGAPSWPTLLSWAKIALPRLGRIGRSDPVLRRFSIVT